MVTDLFIMTLVLHLSQGREGREREEGGWRGGGGFSTYLGGMHRD